MKKIKVMSMFWTRFVAIKKAYLVKKLEFGEKIEGIVCVTAQHRKMLDTVDIKHDYDLNIMKVYQSLSKHDLVLMDFTESLEKIDAGTLKLVI